MPFGPELTVEGRLSAKIMPRIASDAHLISANYWSAPHKPFLWQNRQNRHMNSKLPRLTSLVIVIAAAALAASRNCSCAADTTAKPAHDHDRDIADQVASSTRTEPRNVATPGNELLSQAAAQLERRASVSARLRHQVFLRGKQLYGLGSYWQQGMGDDLRVRLELQIAGQEAALLQVSNSRHLWVERRLPTGRTVTRLDLRQLRADAMLGGSHLDAIQPGNASWASAPPELIAHSGGLPSLLAALGESFSFLPPQAMRLAAPADNSSQATSLPVWAIVGHWRTEKLAELLSSHAEASDDAEAAQPSIPSRLPEEVLILVGQADLFPYRIEYRKLETPIAAIRSGMSIPYQLSANPIVMLELSDVAFDVSVETGQFDYAPGDVEWTDQTASVLQRLRQQREQVATRPAAPRK